MKKIHSTYQLALQRLLQLGEDLKWSSTGENFYKSLTNRGHEELADLVKEDRFATPSIANNSGVLIETLFNAVVVVCEQLKTTFPDTTPKDFWAEHTYSPLVNRIGARAATTKTKPTANEDGWIDAEDYKAMPPQQKRKARKALKRQRAETEGEPSEKNKKAHNARPRKALSSKGGSGSTGGSCCHFGRNMLP